MSIQTKEHKQALLQSKGHNCVYRYADIKDVDLNELLISLKMLYGLFAKEKGFIHDSNGVLTPRYVQYQQMIDEVLMTGIVPVKHPVETLYLDFIAYHNFLVQKGVI